MYAEEDSTEEGRRPSAADTIDGVFENGRCDMAIAGARCGPDSSSDSDSIAILVGLTTRCSDISRCSTIAPFSEAASSKNLALAEHYYRADANTNWPYALRSDCPLSGRDCIRKSILHAEKVAKTADGRRAKVAVVVSASSSGSSSSQLGYPVDEDSGNDGTYSVVEELPSDRDDDDDDDDDNFCLSGNGILSDDDELDHRHLHRHRRRNDRPSIIMYSDRSDDSASGDRPQAENNHRRLFKYVRRCFVAEENIRRCVARANSTQLTATKNHPNVAANVTNDVRGASSDCYEEESDSDLSGACADLGTRIASVAYLLAGEPPSGSPTGVNFTLCPRLPPQTDNGDQTGRLSTFPMAEGIGCATGLTRPIVRPSTPDGLVDVSNGPNSDSALPDLARLSPIDEAPDLEVEFFPTPRRLASRTTTTQKRDTRTSIDQEVALDVPGSRGVNSNWHELNAIIRRWRSYRRERQPEPSQWRMPGHDLRQPRRSRRRPSSLPLTLQALRGPDDSWPNSAAYDVLVRPAHTQPSSYHVWRTMVAACSLARILRHDLAAILPLNESVNGRGSGSFSAGTLRAFYSYSWDTDSVEGDGRDCDRNGIDDVIESLTDCEWYDNSKPVMRVREQLRMSSCLENGANNVRGDKIGRSIERVINVGDTGNDTTTTTSENGDRHRNEIGFALYVSNVEAIRKISDFFNKSLRLDCEIRTGISDLELDIELETRPLTKALATCPNITAGPSSLEDSVDNNNNNNNNNNSNSNRNNDDEKRKSYDDRGDYPVVHGPRKDVGTENSHTDRRVTGKSDTLVEDEDEDEDDQDRVTSFIISSGDSTCSEDEDSENGNIGNRTKAEKNNSSICRSSTLEDVIVAIVEKKTEPPSILKSALRRGAEKYSPKMYRVQFDENLNEYFESDYVILIADSECDGDDNGEDTEYGWCECGSNQSCFQSRYRVDFEVEEDDDFEAENHRRLPSTRSPKFDFTATFDSPGSSVALSPLGDYKNTTYRTDYAPTNFCNKLPDSKMTRLDNTQHENPREWHNESDILSSDKVESRQLQQPQQQKQEQQQIYQQQQQQHQQQKFIDHDFIAKKKDERNPGYTHHRPNEFTSSDRVSLFDDKNRPMGVENETGGRDEGSPLQYITETNATTTITECCIMPESSSRMTVDDISLPNSSKCGNGIGILKGGKFWRCSNTNSGTDCKLAVDNDTVGLDRIFNISSIIGDDRGNSDNDKRSVKFVRENLDFEECYSDKTENYGKSEFILTFNVGNRVVPCNSLKPNSAVRQLFPDPRFINPPTTTTFQRDCPAECADNLDTCQGECPITEESLRAFNEVNMRSVFASTGGKECRSYKDQHFGVISDDENITRNQLVKKTIERDRLRRSQKRYSQHAGDGNHPRAKKKMELSLEERIKLLTCNIDNEPKVPSGNTDREISSTAAYTVVLQHTNLSGESTRQHREEAASSSTIFSSITNSTHTSTATTLCNTSTISYSSFSSSSSSSSSSEQEKLLTYEKFTYPPCKTSDNEQIATVERQPYPNHQSVYQSTRANLNATNTKIHSAESMTEKKSTSSYAATRQQLSLSSASSTSHVISQIESSHGDCEILSCKSAGDRNSIFSTGTEYSIDDIDDALAEPVADEGVSQPVIAADSPNTDSIQDELAVFVERDASRIERIKKRYGSAIWTTATPATSNHHEPDDYRVGRWQLVRSGDSSFDSTSESFRKVGRSRLPTLACSSQLEDDGTGPDYSAACANTDESKAVSYSNRLPTFFDENPDATACAITESEFVADVTREKPRSTLTLPTRTTTSGSPHQATAQIDAASTRNEGRVFDVGPTPFALPTEKATSCSGGKGNGRADPPYPSASSDGNPSRTPISATSGVLNASTFSRTSGRAAQLPIRAANNTRLIVGTTYPLRTGTTSAANVGHDQTRTFHSPSPVSGAIRTRLLGTRDRLSESPQSRVLRSASSQSSLYTRPTHTPIPNAVSSAFVAHRRPSQPITPAKGTRTSAASSTTSLYQLRTKASAGVGTLYPTTDVSPNAVIFSDTATAAAAAAWKFGLGSDIGERSEFIGPSYPVARRSTAEPIFPFGSSATRLELQNQPVERAIPEEAVNVTMTSCQDGVKSQWQPATPLAKSILVAQTKTEIRPTTFTSFPTSFLLPRLSNPSSVV